MTRTDQAKLIASRYLAGAVDRETATMQINILLADQWRGVDPATAILDVALELVRAEARAVVDRRQRAT